MKTIDVMPDPNSEDAAHALEWLEGASREEAIEFLARIDRSAGATRLLLADARRKRAGREWIQPIENRKNRLDRLRTRVQQTISVKRHAETMERIRASDERFREVAREMLPAETFYAIVHEVQRRRGDA